jgi:hypothetical protein
VCGRDFVRGDGREREPVVIVNERLADQLWPNQQAAGQYAELGCRDTQRVRVVGVATGLPACRASRVNPVVALRSE